MIRKAGEGELVDIQGSDLQVSTIHDDVLHRSENGKPIRSIRVVWLALPLL